jgi:H/ACA ribonucleoprotein complex subunit 3
MRLMRDYRHRVTIKKRYGLLITQQKDKVALGAN